MVEGIFVQEEAELIKKFPLPTETYEDSLFWPFTHNEVYNSKFGYRFLKAESAPNVESELVALEKTMWKEVWSLQIPNKMGNLLWRACWNSLPQNRALFDT